ncbi:hypothetical protein L1987_12186 [Smallanthus sonchifolius]|uniref:Uncharacterized protein n=1 Tax=Smallanthus sonchifolius TaxID=185202 RepID=A0ACB9JF63_9ASTR|nr:hypothetical protein L1987_12186 [Smallanthus sonchifolius]
MILLGDMNLRRPPHKSIYEAEIEEGTCERINVPDQTLNLKQVLVLKVLEDQRRKAFRSNVYYTPENFRKGRRLKNGLKINPSAPKFDQSHRLLSPSILDFPALVLSPVTHVTEDSFNKSLEEVREHTHTQLNPLPILVTENTLNISHSETDEDLNGRFLSLHFRNPNDKRFDLELIDTCLNSDPSDGGVIRRN